MQDLHGGKDARARVFRAAMVYAYTGQMDVLAKDPSARITDLALSLGFASSQHFAARFRRETGKTPSEWRASGNRISKSHKRD